MNQLVNTESAGFEIPPDISDNPIFRYMWNAVHNGGNLNVIINGLPRTGKSELALDFMWNLYRGTTKDYEHKFEVKKHVAWSKIDFQKKVSKYKDIGACLGWDEAGIAELGAHARQFWSEGNIALSTLFQIMGFHQQMCFITLPMKIMLDKHLRMLSHISILTYKIDRNKNRCKAIVKWLEPSSSKSNEILSKYPRYVTDVGRYRVKSISIPRPPIEVVEEYKAYSEVFKDWLEKRLIQQEEKRHFDKTIQAPRKRQLNDIFEKIKKNPAPYLFRDGKINVASVQMLENVPYHTASEVRAMWNKINKGKTQINEQKKKFPSNHHSYMKA